MHVDPKKMDKHKDSWTCKRLSERRQNEEMQDEQANAEDIVFKVYGKEIERVREFKYLGRWIMDNDDDTKCIDLQLKCAKKKWNCIAAILKRQGANAEVMSRFYLCIVQAVLLYGSESWTVTKRNMKKLESFHNRAIRYMTGKHICKEGENWSYPDHDELKEKCKLFSLETYIERRRGTLYKYLQENRKELLQEAEKIKPHSKHVNKILWWRQRWKNKSEMNELNKKWKENNNSSSFKHSSKNTVSQT